MIENGLYMRIRIKINQKVPDGISLHGCKIRLCTFLVNNTYVDVRLTYLKNIDRGLYSEM